MAQVDWPEGQEAFAGLARVIVADGWPFPAHFPASGFFFQSLASQSV